MSSESLFLIIPSSPLLSGLTWFILISIFLYIARKQAHEAILSISTTLKNACRLAARAVQSTRNTLDERNRAVLLESGKEHAEHVVERELTRISDAVQHDLGQYPKLQRQLTDLLANIEKDFADSSETPPPPPGWTKAIDEISKMSSAGDTMVAKILAEIKRFLVQEHDRAIKEYRSSSQERHKLLHRMRPTWLHVEGIFSGMDKSISSLLERSKTIDRHIDNYQQIIRGTEHAMHNLSVSSFTQLFIASFVLMIAIGGAIINFNLIARPMAEMVGGSNYLAGFKTSDIAALVIIFVEVAMGIFLMECMRITRLFPIIGALEDKKRLRMLWVALSMLLMLASIEAGLAYMRELLSQDEAALIASLAGSNGAVAETISSRWITTAAQMGMGFILPFALVFVAMPLESFIQSLRTVLGALASISLGVLAFSLRLSGNIFAYAGKAMVGIYDLLIFFPSGIERMWNNINSDKKEA